MLPRERIPLLVALLCVLFGLRVDAAAQAGRLFGNVVYLDAYRRVIPARGARVVAEGRYSRSETRTDNNGNFGFVLSAGTYRVSGQGVNGYSQRVEVRGYVRAHTDSYVTPNPLVLVYAGFRNADHWSGLQLVKPALSADLPTESANEPSVSHKGSPGEQGEQNDTAFVIGIVMREQDGRNVRVNRAYVQAVGDYERSPCRTNHDGMCELRLRAGTWRIRVLPIGGYHQRDVPTITLQKGQRITISLKLVPDKPAQPRSAFSVLDIPN